MVAGDWRSLQALGALHQGLRAKLCELGGCVLGRGRIVQLLQHEGAERQRVGNVGIGLSGVGPLFPLQRCPPDIRWRRRPRRGRGYHERR